MLGLDDYGAAPDLGLGDGARNDVEADSVGTVDSTLADGGPNSSSEASSDASPEMSFQAAADAAEVADAQEALDGAGGADAPPFDGSPDAVDDVGFDVANDATAACPAVCNGQCGPSGATCIIVIDMMTSGPVNCPPGLACEVRCVGTQVCAGDINCAAGQPCNVVCSGAGACTGGAINGQGATSLCVDCSHIQNSTGCNSVTCTGTCSRVCTGPGCNTSCANCASVTACP